MEEYIRYHYPKNPYCEHYYYDRNELERSPKLFLRLRNEGRKIFSNIGFTTLSKQRYIVATIEDYRTIPNESYELLNLLESYLLHRDLD